MTWTRQQLIQELTTLQETTGNATRDKWVQETNIPKGEYEKEFGSFTEFKKAAGLQETTVASRVRLAVARHAKTDDLKAFDEQKQGYDEKFLRPNSSRFQTILTGSDIHDKLCDPFYRRLFVDTALRVQPEKIVLAGDVFDLYEFSRYSKDPRKVDITGAIQWVHNFLEDIREAAPNTEITLVAGNHENRLLKYLSEQAPSILPVLSDIHGMTVSSLLGLDKYEVNYISKDTLGVFNESDIKKEISKNYYIAYDSVLFYHYKALTYGMPGVSGHHHSHTVDHCFSIQSGPYEWHQLGAGHIRAAEYCSGEKWSNGFALVHVDTHTKKVVFDYIDCTNNHAVIGGKWYTRETSELVIAS